MIARLRGVLADKQPNQVLVDVGGVGYRVFIPFSTYTQLPNVGEAAELWTVTFVREDLIHLYGFATQEEKVLFNLLIGVSGVGGRLALAVLSTLAPAVILDALAREDVTTLSRVPGIGKKTAQRLAMELKEKVATVACSISPTANLPGPPGSNTPSPPALLKAELTSALINLGFKPAQVEQTLRRVLTQDTVRLEDGLRLALRDLSA
ncbi:MAG: Holliday junction branch migration protein RuvA [Magnetococcus sp. DMHC-1]|nr:Holliday junction branch migration protein RuvA [Magnetococcales bacterium]MBF0155019.1 Holliday junction branch migration protein RuvA [Magnetococcales bacterium]